MNAQRAMIVVNPHARSGLAVAERLAHRDAVAARLGALLGPGSTVEWCESQYPRHALTLAEEAANNGFSHVLAAGGDGTISEVLNGIMRSQVQPRPVFGVIPWGSLNDFHRALRHSDQRYATSASSTMPLDIGKATFDGTEYFAGLSVSIGLASWANEQYIDASRRYGRIFGLIPGAIRTLLTYHFPQTVQLSMDGEPPQQVPLLSLAMNNSPSVGGGARLTPNAAIDDDHFDLCLIPPISLFRLGLLLAGSYVGGIDANAVTLRRISRVTVIADEPLPVHIDGEMIPVPKSRARVSTLVVLPGELQVLRPSLLA